MAYSYCKKLSPCAPHLFLPLDGVNPHTYLDKQSPHLALLLQKLPPSLIFFARLLTMDSHRYSIYRYSVWTNLMHLLVEVTAFSVTFCLMNSHASIRYTYSIKSVTTPCIHVLGLPETHIPSDRLPLHATGCWVLNAGWVGGISRAAAHGLCGGRSWQLLGHGRWLRGRMGLPGLAVYDLWWWGRRRK